MFRGKPTAEAPIRLKPLDIVFLSNRYLQLDVCDCQIRKLGGVHREWNALQKLRTTHSGTIVNFTGGTTFVPIPKAFRKKRIPFYTKKSQVMVDSLNELGVQVLAPSSDDFALGLDALKELKERAKFPFLTTNIYSKADNKPVFSPFIERELDEFTLLVMSVSSPSDFNYPTNKDITVIPPKTAINEVLKGLDNKPRLIVLISNLSDSQRMGLMDAYPEIHLVLGAKYDASTTFNLQQFRGSSLYHNPVGRGQLVSFIEFEMKAPILSFYNSNVAENIRDKRRIWEQRVAQAAIKLTTEKDPEEIEDIRKERDLFKIRLKRTESIPLVPTNQTIGYESTTVELDNSFQEPSSSLQELIKKYQK